MDFQNRCKDKDDNLLAQMSISDSNYFLCLMRRYEDKLRRYVHNLTFLPNEDIDDIVQNSFVKAYQHLNDCDCELKFSSWMYRIVHNESINFLRKHKIKQKVVFDTADSEFVDWLIDDLNIEQEAVDKNYSEYLVKLLEKLKPEYQEVLMLKYFEDKDYQEISDIIQRPPGTVATLLSRAKVKFKEIYEKDK